jgi:hypothetical protein
MPHTGQRKTAPTKATSTKGKHKSQRTSQWLRVNKMELLSIVLALVNMGLAKRSGTSSVVPQF